MLSKNVLADEVEVDRDEPLWSGAGSGRDGGDRGWTMGKVSL